MTARELNPRARIVVRLFGQELASRAQQQLGIHACHSVSALATPAFVAAALGEGILSIIDTTSPPWLLGQLTVEAGSPLDGRAAASLEQSGSFYVLAMRDPATEWWRPGLPDRFAGGRDLLVACTRERWERAQRQAQVQRRPPNVEASGGA